VDVGRALAVPFVVHCVDGGNVHPALDPRSQSGGGGEDLLPDQLNPVLVDVRADGMVGAPCSIVERMVGLGLAS
jgi:hypothetical protein